MNIKPIKNESDYNAALAEIADLMDARASTPEGDRLDVLVTLVEAYEEKHWRMNPPPIRSKRSSCGWSNEGSLAPIWRGFSGARAACRRC
jgi:antitoxin component HigA of HigAB toxin-antitoxin module